MLIQKFKVLVVALAACAGASLAGGVVLQAQTGGPSPAAPSGVANAPDESPGARVGATGPRDQGKLPPQSQRDEAKQEIAALRKRLDALEQKLAMPALDTHKILVTSPQNKDVVAVRKYVCKIVACRHINISALVTGVVAEVPVKEGQAVKKGDVLFKLVPAIYQAKLDAERAELQIAKVEFDSTKRLFEQKALSPQQLALAEAKMVKAEARMKQAEAELAWSAIRAPFDGLVGRLLEQEGSTIKEGSPLTTLSDNGAVRVYFNVPEAHYLELMTHREQLKEGSPIELVLANGKKFSQNGRLAAIEAQFEKDTGNIAFRADFPNPDGLLRHGQSGTVLTRESLKNVVVIPQQATFTQGERWYVYVVGKDDVAHQREVLLRNEVDDLFVIDKGLEATDRIVFDGVRRVRDGEQVEYEYRKPDGATRRPLRP